MNKNRTILYLSLIIYACLNIVVTAQKTFWAPVNPPKADYMMSVEIDTVKKLVKGSGSVCFTNHGSKNLELIAFYFRQKENGLINVYQNNKRLKPVESAERKTDNLFIYELISPAKPGEKIELKFDFNTGETFSAQYDAITFQAGWHPRLWWDGLTSADNYRVKIKYPSNYILAVTGRMDKKSGDYIGKNIRMFALFLGKGHQVLSKEVQGVLISVVYPPGGIKVAQTAFDIAVEAVPFFKKMYGVFPFPFLNIIPGGSDPWGGYNFAPGMAVIHGMKKYDKKTPLFWKWITVHEIGHHYWGESVFDGDKPSWLWIGLGIYTDREFFKSKKMSEEIQNGFIENNYFESGVMKSRNTTLEITPEEYDKIEWDYNNIVTHGKGFTVMSALESVIGHDAMLKTLKKCYKDYIWKALSWREFEKVCEEITGENLSWFFEEWVRSSAYLSLQVTNISSVKNEKGEYNSVVEIKNKGKMRMPVKAVAFFGDGSTQTAIINRAVSNPALQFISAAKLDSVHFDPEHLLPPLTKEIPLTEKDITGSINALPWSGVGNEVINIFNSAQKINFSNYENWINLGLRMYDYGDLEKTVACFDKAISAAGTPKTYRDSSTVMCAYYWKGLIMDEQKKRDEAIRFYNKALEVSTKFSISFSQFNLVANRENIKKYLLEPYKGFKKSK